MPEQSISTTNNDAAGAACLALGHGDNDGSTGIDASARFLEESDMAAALYRWFGTALVDDHSLSRDRIVRRLNQDISVIDALITEQVQAILHHPAFQKLEAAWRGVRYLTEQCGYGDGVKIKILNVSWYEIDRDINRAAAFDQSQMFKKIYNNEFGMPGGEPIGLLVGDYEVRHRPMPDHRIDDLSTLEGLGYAAAAAFALLIVGASPALFGLDHIADVEQPIDFDAIFSQREYDRWRLFQRREDARFIAVTLPRVLMRLPYEDRGLHAYGFRFIEDLDADDGSCYLWGNASFAFASVAIRAFRETGWLADVRGVDPDTVSCGLVAGLPCMDTATDHPGLLPKPVTEVQISDAVDKTLTDLGFLPLSDCKTTGYAAFYGSSTIQTAKVYDRKIATSNARLSTNLQHMLCASRFAHYVKIMARDKIGSFLTADRISDMLNRWLLGYCNASETSGTELDARYPLKNARVQVKEQSGRPGNFWCTIHLEPRFQFDRVVSSINLVTELARTTP
ncbi:MAG: type VI secretion system contractile sheath large subunit [Geminicoccaceae bacterium]